MAYFKKCFVIKNVEDSTYLYLDLYNQIQFSHDILDSLAFENLEDCENFIYNLTYRYVHFLEIKPLFADYDKIKKWSLE